MKVTKSKLRQIIKEEIENVLNEQIFDDDPWWDPTGQLSDKAKIVDPTKVSSLGYNLGGAEEEEFTAQGRNKEAIKKAAMARAAGMQQRAGGRKAKIVDPNKGFTVKPGKPKPKPKPKPGPGPGPGPEPEEAEVGDCFDADLNPIPCPEEDMEGVCENEDVMYDAFELYDAMKGLGTDEEAIYRILQKNQDCVCMKALYKAYNKVLERKKDTESGDLIDWLRDDGENKAAAVVKACMLGMDVAPISTIFRD
tara:strand:- start:3385 stop:4137 length:753 start_codon:yes stop_codon:yes gene_type:complete